MTDLQKAAQQALEALKLASRNGSDGLKRYELKELDDTIAELYAALAQPEPARTVQPSQEFQNLQLVANLLKEYGLEVLEVIAALKTQPEQEPFGWLYESKAGGRIFHLVSDDKKLVQADWEAAQQYPEAHKMTPLYLHPPQRKPQPEPVAWGCFRNGVLLDDLVSDEASVDYWCESDEPEMQRLVKRALYTTPPSRQPLTDEVVEALWAKYSQPTIDFWDFARAIERAHGIGDKE